MKKKHVFMIFLSIHVSCKNDKNKKIVFDVFEISVPNNWEQISLKGIDSYIGGIKLNNKDTLFFDYGASTSLINDVVIIEDKKMYQKMKKEGFDVENYIFSKTHNLDQNQGVFHKEYYMYDTISGYIPKIKIPKIIGNGLTAVCFDSLNIKKERLYMYAKNLDTVEQFQLLKAFKTIKIKPAASSTKTN